MSAFPAATSTRIAGIVGASQVLTDPSALAAYEVDGLRPSAAALPGSAEEVAELVRLAASEKMAIVPCGARTKVSMGMPPSRYDLAVDLTRLNRVVAYDPGDLTLGVEAGATLRAMNVLLGEHRQFLPLAVPFMNTATIGGTISAGVDSPMRQLYGTPRDYVLGMEFVTGDGARAKSGGNVVKNVTGYDLHKLLIGALGTLGIITRINFKTFPMAPASRGFLAAFERPDRAVAMCRRIAASHLAPSTLEILSPELAQILTTRVWGTESAVPDALLSTEHWTVAASFGGHEDVLGRYAVELARLAADSRATGVRILDDADKRLVWDHLRECLPLLLEFSPAATIVKVSVLPTGLAEILGTLERIAAENELPHAILARATGVAYLALLPGTRDDTVIGHLATACENIFAASAAVGARVVVQWCPLELKRRINVWGAPGADFALMRKVKNTFDPAGMLSPGRFVGGL